MFDFQNGFLLLLTLDITWSAKPLAGFFAVPSCSAGWLFLCPGRQPLKSPAVSATRIGQQRQAASPKPEKSYRNKNRWKVPNWLFDPHHCAKKGPVLCFCRTPPYFCSTCSCSNDPLIIVIRFSSWKFHRVTKLCRLIRPRKKSLNAKATLEIWWGLFSWLFKLGR